MPSMKYVFAPEIHEQAQRIGRSTASTTTPCSPPRSPSSTGTRTTSRWVIRTDRGDEIRARFVGHGHRSAAPPEAAGHPRHRDLRGAQLPHQPLGLRLHGRRPRRRAARKPGRQARRHHRHRRHGGAVHPPPGARREGAVRLPAHAVVDRRPQQPPIDPEWVRQRSARAGSGSGCSTSPRCRPAASPTRTYVKDGWTDIAKRIRDRVVQRDHERRRVHSRTRGIKAYVDSDDEKMDEIRARVDAIVQDPATAEALKPWYRQLCKRPCFHDEYLQAYNVPNATLSTPTARASTASTRPACGSAASTTSSTASSSPPASRWAPAYARRAGFETTGPRRRDAVGALGRRHADPARHARARLPEPVHPRA
jgi:hypothetical protein